MLQFLFLQNMVTTLSFKGQEILSYTLINVIYVLSHFSLSFSLSLSLLPFLLYSTLKELETLSLASFENKKWTECSLCRAIFSSVLSALQVPDDTLALARDKLRVWFSFCKLRVRKAFRMTCTHGLVPEEELYWKSNVLFPGNKSTFYRILMPYLPKRLKINAVKILITHLFVYIWGNECWCNMIK